MIETFKFPIGQFNEKGEAVLGTIPAGRILKSEPVFDDGKPHWLIEVDTAPEQPAFTEHYRP